jgi:hypothetical protein
MGEQTQRQRVGRRGLEPHYHCALHRKEEGRREKRGGKREKKRGDWRKG